MNCQPRIYRVRQYNYFSFLLRPNGEKLLSQFIKKGFLLKNFKYA